jgi:hypothetical protein
MLKHVEWIWWGSDTSMLKHVEWDEAILHVYPPLFRNENLSILKNFILAVSSFPTHLHICQSISQYDREGYHQMVLFSVLSDKRKKNCLWASTPKSSNMKANIGHGHPCLRKENLSLNPLNHTVTRLSLWQRNIFDY